MEGSKELDKGAKDTSEWIEDKEWNVTLPLQPLPELEETLRKYLATMHPVLSDDDYVIVNAKVNSFLDSGVGMRSQDQLKERRANTDNWAVEWWLNDMYMKNPDPLPIHSNPAMLLPEFKYESLEEKIRFATSMVVALLDYRDRIIQRLIDVDKSFFFEHGVKRETTVCMAQWDRLFSTTRLPGRTRDIQACYDSIDSRHIIVALKGQFFSIPVVVCGKRIEIKTLYSSLVEAVALSGNREGSGVGAFTSCDRRMWSHIRDKLFENETNRLAITDIESSAFLLCLDEESLDQADKEARAAHMMHGSASSNVNRWYDKGVQIIVCDNGIVGVNYEHSQLEGIIVVKLFQDIWPEIDRIYSGFTDDEVARPFHDVANRVTALNFNVEDVEEDLKVAIETFRVNISRTHLKIINYRRFGKDFAKEVGMSADALIQVVLHLSYYRCHQELTHTYESASQRVFYLGRVDNNRTLSDAVKQYVQSPGNTSLLKKSVKAAAALTAETKAGLAIDLHLLCLRECALEMGDNQATELFDEFYDESNRFRLSTSQISTEADIVMYYGPVVADGYGCSYNIRAGEVVFCVTSFDKHMSRTFAKTVGETMDTVYEALG
uniref:Choline O-acetyltransferase n=1 Tax=Meara stichopi TaxID=84115 RepID=A0A2P1DVD0_9BILA|nr:choline acetyltransferase [Meara stichopi]